jgi:hypothetical protein
VSTPEPVPSAAESVTATGFAYVVVRQGLPLQRTVTVGGVGSGTSVNEAPGDVRPAPFVAVTLSAADGTGSGVDTIRYTTNGTDPTVDSGIEYTRTFSVRTLARLRVRAFDKAGNASNPAVMTIRSAADRLVFSAPPRLAVKSGARYLFARVTSTRRAIASATMTGPNLKTPQRWHFVLGSGRSIVQLRLPARLAHTGRYRVVWTVRAGTQKTSKTTLIAVGRPKAKTS